MVGRGLVGSWDARGLKELKCAPGRKDLGQLEAKTLRGRGQDRDLRHLPPHRPQSLHSPAGVKYAGFLE